MRQTEAILNLSPWFNLTAREIQKAISQICSAEYTDYADYMKKYAGKAPHTSLKLLGNYFEGVGLLVSRKLVETNIVYDFWGDIALSIWEGNEEVISGMRRESNAPHMFEYWEFLAKKMKTRLRDK